MRSYLAMMMLRAGSRLVRSQRCGGVEMLRKIAEYAKKIFWAEPMPTTVNIMREWTAKPVKFEEAKVKVK